ncbi:hypothetical protein TSUD_405030 [Trifolium subterraneum]|uniref:Reverse transcriptase domain-containing protein n=1 Tax=Trifolium subterraneum TaxID=3900 RepID=A0A2Z6NXP9_TRISU|nr:hypothetical protein TSUD_405030 [Trifolium subterraneum]
MRGWGGSAKRRRLNSFLQKGAFDVCLLQETKKANIEDHCIHNLWGHTDVSWVVKESKGLSGGIRVDWEGNVLNIVNTVKDLKDIEGLLGEVDMEVELTIMEGLNKDFWRQLHLKESLLKQKSRMRWVKEGDSNSRYFHESIKNRRRRNQLVALKDGDRWVQGVKEAKGYVKQFFENNFRENWGNKPNLNGITFNSLSEEDNFSLLALFSVEEVREVILSSDGNKCPGPDGFNFNFLKSYWDIIKGDIMEFLAEFHKSANLPKAITASFLALIQKNDHPQALSDYQPICLVSSLYKILSKVLAARLKKVMGKLISKVQSGFLPNKHILDGVLVVNELIDLAKRRKAECLLFKVDFEWAYDSVNWNFLEYMMTRMGFAEGWRRWIHACVFQSSMSVLVNGSTTEDFKVVKGLRQGDPLSPFLFSIVAEGLTGLMRSAVDRNRFHSYKGLRSLNILQFGGEIFGGWVTLDWTTMLIETESVEAMELLLLLEQVQLCSDSVDKRREGNDDTASVVMSCRYEE